LGRRKGGGLAALEEEGREGGRRVGALVPLFLPFVSSSLSIFFLFLSLFCLCS